MSMAEIHAAVIVRERRSCELQTAVFYASSFMNSKTPSALSRCWWALWLINMFFGLEAVASGLVSVQRLSSHLRPVALTENNRIQTHTRAVIIWPFWAGCMINCLLGHLILTPGAGGGGGGGVPYQYLRPDLRPWLSSSTENEACRCNIPELPVAREGTTHSDTSLFPRVCPVRLSPRVNVSLL